MMMAPLQLVRRAASRIRPDTFMRSLSGNGQGRERILSNMVPIRPNHRLLPALVCLAGLFLLPSAAWAQVDLGLDLGGLGSVDVGIGGDEGLGVDVDLGGDDSGLGVDLNLGGSGGSGVGLDLETAGKPLGQKAALQAVRSGRALPMEDIMLRAQVLTDGEIIDAQLVSLQDVLLYEIKALGKSGEVSELYFLAQTGEYLDLN
jgi:hypothetical protein